MSGKTWIFAALVAMIAGCASAPAEIALRADALRTPDAAFENLEGYPFAPNYVAIDGYRMHYVDQGDRNADPVLMLHGEPTWSYLYRKMIPPVTDAGNRAIAPDLIGFGRSDKPKDIDTHTYAFHVANVTALIETLDLRNITLVCQDWGSLIGLRVAAENPDRFARIVLANGALPLGETNTPGQPGPAFMAWLATSTAMRNAGDMPLERMFGQYGPDAAAGYAAPYPDPTYKPGPLAMPMLVPITPDNPAVAANRRAWDVYSRWTKPFLTAFSDGDPVTRGGDVVWQAHVPGARGQKHTTIKGAGHFLQEDNGEELARVVIDFIRSTPIAK